MYVQVVVAVDDSRSMGENGCGSFALEAVTLICRAMARLEVGEMGVVSYGGSNSILPLHPLEKPFTDADGPGIMAQMKFSQVCSLPLLLLMQGVSSAVVVQVLVSSHVN